MTTVSANAQAFDPLADERQYVVTFEQTKAELERVEWLLAKKLDLRLSSGIRGELLRRACAGLLHEDDLVLEWQELYTTYRRWPAFETPPRANERSEKEAADAAFFF